MGVMTPNKVARFFMAHGVYVTVILQIYDTIC